MAFSMSRWISSPVDLRVHRTIAEGAEQVTGHASKGSPEKSMSGHVRGTIEFLMYESH